MGSSIANASVTATPGLSSGGGGAGFYVIFGLVTGILSLTGLIQLGYSFIELYLPSTRLKALDAASNETIDLYRSMLEDGLFAHPDQARSMEHRLSNLRRDSDRLRSKVHIAITFKQQLLGWWYGVSQQLDKILREVEAARAEISVICSEERQRQEREDRLPRPKLLPPSRYSAPQVIPAARQHHISAPDTPTIDPSTGRATGITGLHTSQSSLSTRAHAYASKALMSGHHLLPPPPAFVPTPLPGTTAMHSEPDPHQRLRNITDQLLQATGNHGLSEMPVLPTGVADDGKIYPSEIERTMNVLNDLTKRLAVIAAQELTRSQNGQVSSTAGQADSAQLSKLIDGLKAVHATTTQPRAQSNTNIPLTATIVEVDTPPQTEIGNETAILPPTAAPESPP